MPIRFAKVTKGLFRGGEPSLKDLILFKKHGINKIVSLDKKIGDVIDPICDGLDFEHIICDLGDGNSPEISILKKKIIPNLLDNGPTYIHCKHGKDRTGMAIAMFRIYNGWNIKDALKEAKKFGMGDNLPERTKRSYYKAVLKYDNEIDSNNNSDIVSITRETNPFGPKSPAIDNSSFTGSLNSFSPMCINNKAASHKIFCKCKSKDLLLPNINWWNSKELAIKNPQSENGKLYSANISSFSIIENFNKIVNKNLIDNILTKNIDIGILRNGQYVILSPDILINIQEEDDSNDALDFGIIGNIDNSTQMNFYRPFSGSGLMGVPEGAAVIPGGAAGPSSLPFTGPGHI